MVMVPISTHINCSHTIPANTMLDTLLDKNKQPTPSLLKLLEKNGCDHDGSLPTIVAAVQKKFLRQAGTERWENQTNTLPDTEQLQLFKELNLIQEIIPTQKQYDYALLLGGVLEDVHIRVEHLINLWKNEGIRFKSLIILTGERPLDEQIESKQSLISYNVKNICLPTTEYELMKFVLAQTDLPIEWKKSSFSSVLVNAPMQKMADGSLRRPNTEDTIIEWLTKHNPYRGTILAVSNQPFGGYQDAALRKNLSHFTIETVGAAYKDNESVATILDALARWLYNELQIINNQQSKY